MEVKTIFIIYYVSRKLLLNYYYDNVHFEPLADAWSSIVL